MPRTENAALRLPAPRDGSRGPKNPWLIHLALLLLSAAFLFPFFWVLSTSLKPVEETMKSPPAYLPTRFVWENYIRAFTYQSDRLGYVPMLAYLRNTLLVSVLTVGGALCSNALVAYAFARLRWPGRDLLFAITLATMMVPFPVIMVPTFALFHRLHWIGGFRPLWVPAWFGSAFYIFLLRQFFRSIPLELSESARIDGAGEWTIFRDVVLPLARPALAVVALFTFMATWNDFLGPLIYLTDQRLFTLGLGLQQFQSQQGGTDWNLLMAASAMVIGPVLVLFIAAQKQFIEGIAVSGLKG